MNNERLAQIILHQNHGFAHKPDWKQVDFTELQRAMESEYWFKERDELLKMVGEPIPEPEPVQDVQEQIPEPTPLDPPKPKPTPNPKAEPKKLEIEGITAYELGKMELPDVKWFVEKLIPAGLTLLAGDAKIGKSFFAWNLALAVADGGIALSEIHIDTPRNVTYMAFEDSLDLLTDRLDLMCPEGMPKNVHIVKDIFGKKFDDDGLELVGDYLDKTESEMLIVDTWAYVKPNPQLKNATSYDTDYAALIPVQRFAQERNIAVVLVTHTTKGKDLDNPFNNLQGSMGMQAGCDTMLMIERGQNGHTLRSVGRRIIETEYAMTLDDGIWKLEGDASEFNISERRKQLLRFITESGEDGITVTDLTDLAETSKQNVSKILLKMVSDGLIVRPKRGRYKLA